jgi:hypothetical protein
MIIGQINSSTAMTCERNQYLRGYLAFGFVGALIVCGYWWFAGRFPSLSEDSAFAGDSNPKPVLSSPMPSDNSRSLPSGKSPATELIEGSLRNGAEIAGEENRRRNDPLRNLKSEYIFTHRQGVIPELANSD